MVNFIVHEFYLIFFFNAENSNNAKTKTHDLRELIIRSWTQVSVTPEPMLSVVTNPNLVSLDLGLDSSVPKHLSMEAQDITLSSLFHLNCQDVFAVNQYWH